MIPSIPAKPGATTGVFTETEKERSVKQPHTEETIKHSDGEQNTGNHKKQGAPDAKGADRFGGTRAGAENVEPDARRKRK